jgi:multiple antibiotic resistance protein
MTHIPAAFLLTLPALITIINPVGAALIFSQVVHGRTDQASIINRVSVYSLVVMLGALWAGSYIMNFFGITLAALRIAGGLVIALRAWTLLTAPEKHEAQKKDEAQVDEAQEDVAFFPLTMPFTTGPGTIAVTVAIGAERPIGDGVFGFFIGATAACLVMAAVIWITYRFADRLVSLLGTHGAAVLTRVIAFLLLCIGTQITINGLLQAVGPLVRG